MNRLFILLALCAIHRPAIALAERPNVVILFTDDQGTLDANCYGSTDLYTPHIDQLAATGARFTQAYAHTVCCPARAMLLTGRHPQRGGVHFWAQGDMNAARGINMALEEVTLAEALKAAGYRTALYGKWHLGAHRDYGPKKHEAATLEVTRALDETDRKFQQVIEAIEREACRASLEIPKNDWFQAMVEVVIMCGETE